MYQKVGSVLDHDMRESLRDATSNSDSDPFARVWHESTQQLKVILWDTATGSVKHTLESSSLVGGPVTFAHSQLLIASGRTQVGIWDFGSPSPKFTFNREPEHTGNVTCLVFSQDDKTIVTGYYDSEIFISNCTSEELQRALDFQLGPVNSISLCPTYHILEVAVRRDPRGAWVLDAHNTEPLQCLLLPYRESITQTLTFLLGVGLLAG
ncbi:uncharacterized protein DSM5745_11363 [Aspergillus mulundensis]|uniref:Uncharacterized protein n=1 Tax=Aspergillus mulundensis TaxID=1810919 RepID=A0A3D8Q7N4_9EURO|nr:hypothetical protein DSM5745_11363 [Aspergillus mulundensis]RDW57845.1 hypothetical protein DSM5745_11363 [Aspergillus mulundensis]